MRKRQQPPYPFWRHHIQQYNKKMGKHPNTNWILKTKICYVMRGHKGCRRVEVFSIYFEGIQGFGKCNRTDIFTRCHYWACTEKKGEGGGCRYFIHVIIILQAPCGPPPSPPPYHNIHAQAHPHLYTIKLIIRKWTDNQYNHRMGWMLAFSLTTKALLIPV